MKRYVLDCGFERKDALMRESVTGDWVCWTEADTWRREALLRTAAHDELTRQHGVLMDQYMALKAQLARIDSQVEPK